MGAGEVWNQNKYIMGLTGSIFRINGPELQVPICVYLETYHMEDNYFVGLLH